MKKLAIAVYDGAVSSVLDFARCLLLVTVRDGVPVEQRRVPLPGESLIAQFAGINEHDIEVLLCGVLSTPLARRLIATGIEVVPGLSGPVDEVIRAYLEGRLDSPAFHMPGDCCRRRRRNRCRRGRTT